MRATSRQPAPGRPGFTGDPVAARVTAGRPLLVLDTATRQAVVGLAATDGSQLIALESWGAGHRHGDELLSRLDALLAGAGIEPARLGGICVGTGPGSFTGLRIGLATAKVLAYSLALPIVGIATSRALGRALADESRAGEVAVVLPAGARDRYLARLRLGPGHVEELGPPQIVAAFDAAQPADSDDPTDGPTLVAVDLEPPEVPAEAARLGRAAVAGLPLALAHEGAAELAAGRLTDVATLVPGYVALPRGIAAAAESMQWSPDLR